MSTYITPKHARSTSRWQSLARTPSPIGGNLLNQINGKYYIPIVFHVLGRDSTDLAQFPTTRIQQQLDSLNAHFDRNNTNIVFCLVRCLPDGSTDWSSLNDLDGTSQPGMTYTIASNYIRTYKPTDTRYIANFLPAAVPTVGDSANFYLNVYLVDSIDLPGTQGLVGVSSLGVASEGDAIAVEKQAFIGGSLGSLGKTLTHEVGHWLGLGHVFGADDDVCDTYNQIVPTSSTGINDCVTPYSIGLPSCAAATATGYDQGQNHLDYHLETCLEIFTAGQTNRMHTLLDNDRINWISERNLINTGLWQSDPNACIDSINMSASFVVSAQGVCTDQPTVLSGTNVAYDNWTFSAFWDVNNNSGTAAPNSNNINFDSTSASNTPPATSVSFGAAGTWSIVLTVSSTINGTLVTKVDTQTVTIVDCSQSASRNRLNTEFDTTEARPSYVAMDYSINPSGTYAMTGSLIDSNGIETAFLMQTDSFGYYQWQKEFSIAGQNVRIFDIKSGVEFAGVPQCYALVGYVQDGALTMPLLIITDKDGNLLYQKTYPTDRPYAVAQKVIQRQNGNLVLSGFAGQSAKIIDMNRVGFVWEIDDTPTANIIWQKIYESTPATSIIGTDGDMVDNVVEIFEDFGNGVEPALVISGAANRKSPFWSFGAVFLSCLRGSTAGNITEEWRLNIESPPINNGEVRIGKVAYAPTSNRLFLSAYAEINHSTTFFELDPKDGSRLYELIGPDMDIDDMIYDNGSLVISGFSFINTIVPNEQLLVKVAVADTNQVFWDASNAIVRQYDNVLIEFDANNFYNPFRGLWSNPKNLLKSPNGGYMAISEVAISEVAINAPNFAPIGIIAHKVDEQLISACGQQSNGTLGLLTNGLAFPTINDTDNLLANVTTPSLSVDTLATRCQYLSCTAGDQPPILTSTIIAAGGLTPTTVSGNTFTFDNVRTKVEGSWLLDPNTTYVFTNTAVIEMNAGAEIIVPATATLVLEDTRVRACEICLWHRILVQDGGTLTIRNATIKDAQYAIEAENGATITEISTTKFRDNFIGLYTAPNPTGNNFILGQFASNTFRTTNDGLLLPFKGLAPTPTLVGDTLGNLSTVRPVYQAPGLAGVLVWDLPALNLLANNPSSTANDFRKMVAGIVTFRGSFSTNSCNFQNLQIDALNYPSNLAYQGVGIHGQGEGTFRIDGIYAAGCNFTNCDIGISGIGMGIEANQNKFKNIANMGVRSLALFDNICRLRDNSFDNMRRIGVGIFNPIFPSDVLVRDNTFDMRPQGIVTGSAVFYSNIFGENTTMEILNNTIAMNSRGENGISIIGYGNNSNNFANQARITSNTITLRGNQANRAGLTILDSRLQVRCNDIAGNNSSKNTQNTYGILSASTPNLVAGANSLYQCNRVNKTQVGIQFEGIHDIECKGNQMDDHEIGLLLTPNAEIGVQIHEGNLWTGNADEDAQNFNILGAPASRFIFDQNVPNTRPNNFFTTLPTGWFTQAGANGNTFECTSLQFDCNTNPNTAALRASTNGNNLNPTDNALANGTFSTTAYTAAATYRGKRLLYRKLMQNPNLNQGGNYQNFLNACQNNCIGHFDQVSQQAQQALSINSADSITLDSLHQVCQSYLDTLQCLDSLLAMNFSSSIASTRTALAQQYQQARNQQQTYLDNLHQQRQTAIAPICNTNSSFSTNVLHEQLEQQVNTIYLNTIAVGIFSFNNQQLNVLRLIASYCPQEGGVAVHHARSMLALVEPVSLVDFDCGAENYKPIYKQEEEPANTEWTVDLYPNPTDSRIIVNSNHSLESDLYIEIYNSLGQLVLINIPKADNSTMDIDVTNLLDGVYIMRLKNGDISKTRPFVVFKSK